MKSHDDDILGGAGHLAPGRRSRKAGSPAEVAFPLAAAVVSLLLIVGCAKTQTEVPATEPVVPSATAAEPGKAALPQPSPEAQILIPAVRRMADELLVVWKKTGLGSLETQGYDTEILRFARLGPGTIRGVDIIRRDVSGETLTGSYVFGRSAQGFEILSDTGEDKGKALYLLSWIEGSLIAKGRNEERSYSRGADGSLTFVRTIGTLSYVDSWKAPTGESEHSKNGALVMRGWYEAKGQGQSVFTMREVDDPDGALDTTLSFFAGEGETRLRSESVAPLSESLVAGEEEYLKGAAFLENAAFIDIIVSLVSGSANDPGLRPFLALRSLSIR